MMRQDDSKCINSTALTCCGGVFIVCIIWTNSYQPFPPLEVVRKELVSILVHPGVIP